MHKSVVYILLNIAVVCAFGQQVEVVCENKPLSGVLVEMRNTYSIQFSFNSEQLSNYKISRNASYASPEEAIRDLLKGLPLSYELKHGVYLIFEATVEKKETVYLIKGQVVDVKNNEPLPFCHVLINQVGLISDFNGYFSFKSASDSVYQLQVSYLGYYLFDTLLHKQGNYTFQLKPSTVSLQEVIVEAQAITFSTQVGESSGTMRLNPKAAAHLPGNGDNTVFNLLRLQPGIVASSEQSSELIIWGSYDGQNQALFDGFSIYKLKNYHDNISAVNPFMAKDIKVLKGGYGAAYGEQVGGIVNVTGKEGNTSKPTLNFSINNLTLNGMASVPVFKQSALTFAYRQTYYNLYEPFSIKTNQSKRGPGNDNSNEVTAVPDYDFHDMNAKYSGKLKNGDNYYVSFFRGKDVFSYKINEERNNSVFEANRSEENIQNGASFFYGKGWNSGVRSNITLSYSSIETNYHKVNGAYGLNGNYNVSKNEQDLTSRRTMQMRFDNYIPINRNHAIETGIEIEDNLINRALYNFGTEEINNTSQNVIPTAYLIDNISLGTKTTLQFGVRANYPNNLNKLYVQPRISAGVKLSEYMRLTAAWGLYNQFVSKSPLVDSLGNHSNYWTVADEDEFPVLKAQHYVLGWSYAKNGFLFSMEGYFKHTDGVSMYSQNQHIENDIYHGDSRSKGIDLFLKKDYKGHSAWVSYSLSKTEDRYPITLIPNGRRPVYIGEEYKPALHDQRHEVKVAGIVKLKSFYFSANYVFGSGFPDRRVLLNASTTYSNPYNRLDASVIYKFDTKKIGLETGISILNVLNTDNSSSTAYNRTITEQGGILDIQTGAIPLTPTIYLNFSF